MDESETRERFAQRYASRASAAHQRVEQAVIGATWGANGYTTLAQADGLAELLDLGPADLLLDIGAGRGWPGLYLAHSRGCAAVLVDLPVEGIRIAVERARAEGVANRVHAVAASATALPLRSGCVDAVVHTDVLC